MLRRRSPVSIAITVAVLLLCIRGFLAGRNPPAFGQELSPRGVSPSTSAEDFVQDYRITANTDAIAKVWARINKQDDSIGAVDKHLTAIQAKLEAQSNFWSLQNGGVGFGVLAMLGYQVHPYLTKRRRPRPPANTEED